MSTTYVTFAMQLLLHSLFGTGASRLGCCASLPPHVDGQTKGRLHVRVASLEWAHSIEPPSWTLAVRLRWWGEDGPGAVFRYVMSALLAVAHL